MIQSAFIVPMEKSVLMPPTFYLSIASAGTLYRSLIIKVIVLCPVEQVFYCFYALFLAAD